MGSDLKVVWSQLHLKFVDYTAGHSRQTFRLGASSIMLHRARESAIIPAIPHSSSTMTTLKHPHPPLSLDRIDACPDFLYNFLYLQSPRLDKSAAIRFSWTKSKVFNRDINTIVCGDFTTTIIICADWSRLLARVIDHFGHHGYDSALVS